MKFRGKITDRRPARRRVNSRQSLMAAAFAAMAVMAGLLCLGLTQFSARGFLAQSGYAVAPDILSRALRSEVAEQIALEQVDIGEAVFTRNMSAGTYFIGESKRAVSAGYPVFTQSGQVLFFLDNGLKMVTAEWEVLDSYEGLYLSDGMTFNEDRSQADISEVTLVQVDGGYQVARAATISGAGRATEIPMNSICAFGEDSVTYYAYDKGLLSGATAAISPGSTIAVGSKSYDYLDFLERLGLWAQRAEAEEPVVSPAPIESERVEENGETPPPKTGENVGEDGREGDTAGEITGGTEGLPARPAPEGDRPQNIPDPAPEREPSDRPAPPMETPPPASDVVESPAPPATGGSSGSGSPAPPAPPPDRNPGYVEPTVSFSKELTPWVYTVSVKATVHDPSNVLTGGVQIYVYEIGEDGKETQVLRRIVTTSGTVVLGQLRPDREHRITAAYKYLDKLNYPQSRSLEVGEAKTLPFASLGPIAVSFYDHSRTPAGAAAVEVFSNCLQLRNLKLDGVSSGIVTEVGGVSTHPSADPLKAETYLNVLSVKAQAVGAHGETAMAMDNAALRLLREGFTLSHWETPDGLRSGTQYIYTLSASDRYGNEFALSGDTSGSGNTCSQAPTVSITVPAKSNIAGSTQIQVVWKNPENARVAANIYEGSAMGELQTAGLYLVEQGKAVIPENAVELEGYPVGGDATNGTKGRFFPITVNTDDKVTTVTTGWVLTNLPMLKNYTAGVLCGYYEVDDNQNHYDETLRKTTDFITASLANLGTVSYTAEVDQLTQTTGRLKFRMNSADGRLLPLLSEVSFTVRQKGGNDEVQSVMLSKEELDSVALELRRNDEIGLYEAAAPVELQLNGGTKTVRASIGFQGKNPPTPERNSVWQYLLATASTAARDECWLTLTLGGDLLREEGDAPGKLMTLTPSTSYAGRFTTGASQGGALEDVTSGSSRPVNFTTLSEEAVVRFSNAFISTDFIELYDVSIMDVGSCILPDDADRGGKNVQVRILDEGGVPVAGVYIDSGEGVEKLRLSGLTTGKTYTLIFSALKYDLGGAEGVELNRRLRYEEPQKETDPYVYTFTTGDSVVGGLALGGVNQLYRGNDGQLTENLGVLTAADFYSGAWQSSSSLYYYCDLGQDGLPDPGQAQEAMDRYLAQVDQKEQTEELRALARGDGRQVVIRHVQNAYPNDSNAQQLLADSWTSRFIAVTPGERYVINCPSYSSYGRVTFYYRDNAGMLKYYSSWSNDYYFMGGVFAVPTTAGTNNANADKICYMRISGYNAQATENLFLERYDAERLEHAEQLVTPKLSMVSGMALDVNNNIYRADTLAYTADYIPVTSGSYYELKGRDPNFDETASQNGTNRSSGNVFFYNKDFVFIGRYEVSNQTSVIRAPFSAAYCRFNVVLSQADASAGPVLDVSQLSMKPYLLAVQDRLQATLRARLTDRSESQLLRDGSYSLALYTTTVSVSDSEDLSKAQFVPIGEPKTFRVGTGDLTEGKLDISQSISFHDLTPGMGFKAVLTIYPKSWAGGGVSLSTVYFTTNRVVRTIATLADLKSVRNDPAGSYIVTADISGMTGAILSNDRPFTGTIDFQGHTLQSRTSSPLFYRISTGGAVKNLVMEYSPRNASTTAAISATGAVSYINYGTLQNVILKYDPASLAYEVDVTTAGGLTRYNYGAIDGFAIRLMRDVRVDKYVGLICSENYGTISNGYVTAEAVEDGASTRPARLEHVWRSAGGAVLSTDTTYVSLGVGINTSRGTISNVFVLGDLTIQSADASTDRSNADYQGSGTTLNPKYETSTTNTATAAILAGTNQGTLRNAFTAGDRLDHDPVKGQWSYMIDRGPAIGSVSGRNTAENVVYFSNAADPYSQYSSADSTIKDYNIRGSMESLYDYQWYASALGQDGGRFNIRENVDMGYYPQLILPDCFPAETQPRVQLPGLMAGNVEIQHNEVRLQGVDEALVTVTMTFPYAANGGQITGFTVVDRNNVGIEAELLAQRTVEDNYRVDLLLSLPESGAALPDSSYTITGVNWTGGSQSFMGQSGARVIRAAFWQEIDSPEDWKTYFVSPTSSIYGNYLLTEDLDFLESGTYNDWYCARNFYGALDGGIYSLKQVGLTSEAGAAIKDASGAQRMIDVRGTLSGMRTVSGVGNLGTGETVVPGRDGSNRGSLVSALYGTVKNMVFSGFYSEVDPDGKLLATVKSGSAGVIANAYAGALLENCHVRHSRFYGTTNVGGLVGNASSASLRSCSARQVEVSTHRPAATDNYSVSVGGLAGYASGSVLEGCFAAEVTVRASDVYEANGVGGLAGYAGGTAILNCYSTGLVEAGASRVGGITGQLAGSSSLTGCWSTASVMTVADFAGGIAGYHADGVLSNNFTSSTVVTRSLAASGVHRICSNTDYSETLRYSNYALAGQYITYFDSEAAQKGESVYQFGVWGEPDGATSLLSSETLCQGRVWLGVMGIADGYDISGNAVSGLLSGGSSVLGVERGYMPKLRLGGTDQLLYDQPDVEIGYVSSSVLSRVSIDNDDINEVFTVTLALFSDRADILTADFESLADWEHMQVTGGEIVQHPSFVSDTKPTVFGVQDQGAYSGSAADPRPARSFKFQVKYGAAAGQNGHYLDSYILTLPVSGGEGASELLQMRLSLTEPVYKVLYSVGQWDTFFKDPKYAASYENIQLGWLSEGDGIIDFAGEEHALNVRVNRLSGKGREDVHGKMTYPTLRGLNVTFKTNGQSLISQAVTELSNLNFEDLSLSSTYMNTTTGTVTRYGGDMKGVVAQLQGNMRNVTFKNIVVDGGGSSYVGCVGRTYGTLENVALENIWIETNGSYVGGLVGYANTTATLRDITLAAEAGKRNYVCSRIGQQVGGLAGRLDGIGSGLAADLTDVRGNVHLGGVVGYATGNGGRPAEYKLENVTVGDSTKVSSIPGASDAPGVTVQARPWDTQIEGTYSLGYVGGAVGYGGNQAMRNVRVYDTRAAAAEKAGNDTLDNGAYNYFVGGVAGDGAGGLKESLAQNCTVVSYGGLAGGLSGTGVSWYNTAQDCLVYSLSEKAMRVGGAVGSGTAERTVAQHCVVAGNAEVGGLVGRMTGYSREGGAVDCVVLGRDSVGGLVGGQSYYYLQRTGYVTATLDDRGDAEVTTAVTEGMLPEFLRSMAGTYTGSYIKGEKNVGGAVGTFRGVTCNNLYVGSGVTVEGKINVGGLAGSYYGWSADTNPTSDRSLYTAASGAAVKGKDYVGGLIGRYEKDAPVSGIQGNKTGDAPTPANFYGLLFTGTVDGDTNVDILMPGLLYDSTQFTYSRVYEHAAINGAEAGGIQRYDDVMAKTPASSRGEVAAVLSVTAENLSDSSLFFAGRGTTYGGMGWSKSYWDGDVMQRIYAQVAEPADFGGYSDGVKDDSLLLWLDARNNTGAGYTDPDAAVWKDLSGKKNAAELYWNNKRTGDGTFTISERTNNMYWSEGALEFFGGGSAYYAQLEKSLSPYLQGDYTIEMVYTYTSPYYSGHNTPFGWRDGVTLGGFSAPYNNNYQYMNFNAAGSLVSVRADSAELASGPLLRTTTYAVESAKDGTGNGSVMAYQNGQQVRSAPVATKTALYNTDSTVWRVGDGQYGNASLRLYGVRVYEKTLTAEEVKRHADYDAWYYFGEEMPEGASARTPSSELALNVDGGVSPGGSYRLLRSEDGSYNGTLVTDAYAGGGLGSRGYYYLMDMQGRVSNVVQRQGLTLGPAMKTESLSNEYFGTAPYKNLRGQEGAGPDGALQSVNDDLYYGGMSLPLANVLKRDGRSVSAATAPNAGMKQSALPAVTGYASGADRVNLELRSDPPEGLTYAVEVNGAEVLRGEWPSDRRTLTMTWDFQTSFTLQLDLNGEMRESEWSASGLARTVMTWGEGYWYFYDGACYGADGPLSDSGPYVHMMDGLLLDEGGELWRVWDGVAAGRVTSFTQAASQPLWSGEVAGVLVESFGTYTLGESGPIDTQLVVKGDRAYTMPSSGVQVGSFIVDSYGESVYTTVLGSDGALCDMGAPLRYPEEFSNGKIREISGSLNYKGHILLVRYHSGLLAAFDYLTGERIEVLSSVAEPISVFDFLMESIRKLGGSTALSGAQRQTLEAVEYETEVAADQALSTALDTLKVEDPGGVAAEEPTEAEKPGGSFEGGGEAETPGGEIVADGAGTESGTELSDGWQTADGSNLFHSDAPGEGDAGAYRGEGDSLADGTERPEPTGAPPKSESASESAPSSGAETTGAVLPPRQSGQPAVEDGNSGTVSVWEAQSVKTRYVTVYDPASGESAVYDLEELVKKPPEELVSQKERAEQLEQMGFTTSLLQEETQSRTAVNGWSLLLLVSACAVLLLLGLAQLRRSKLEEEERE